MRTVNNLSRELIPLTLTNTTTGEPITRDVLVALVDVGGMPNTWKPLDVADDGATGYLLSGSTRPGVYNVWAKIAAGSESPVLVSPLIRVL